MTPSDATKPKDLLTTSEKNAQEAPAAQQKAAPVRMLTDTEAARVENWKEKKIKAEPINSFTQKEIVDEKSGKKQTLLVCGVRGSYQELAKDQQLELQQTELSEAIGTVYSNYSDVLLYTTLNAMGNLTGKNHAETASMVYEALLGFGPKDEVEGMLCSRMIVLHQAYMGEMSIILDHKNTRPQSDSATNRATKLMRLYNETLETLMRYRRKGEQKVVVQHNHVNVNNGGQAMVGSQVNQGGGVHDKK